MRAVVFMVSPLMAISFYHANFTHGYFTNMYPGPEFRNNTIILLKLIMFLCIFISFVRVSVTGGTLNSIFFAI
jgi:hypothetical protein